MKRSDKIAEMLEKGSGAQIQAFGNQSSDGAAVTAFMSGKGKVIAAAVLATAIGFSGYPGQAEAGGMGRTAQDDRGFLEKNQGVISGLMRSAAGMISDQSIRKGVNAIDQGVRNYNSDLRKSNQEVERQQREIDRQAEADRRAMETRLRAAEAETRRLQAELKLMEAKEDKNQGPR